MDSQCFAVEEVTSFFDALNSASIEYALVKNIDGELPGRLVRGKDIDILVPAERLPHYFDVLKELGFTEVMHPQSSRAGWAFAYGASDCFMHADSSGLMVDVRCELCLKALEGNIWIPLERHINQRIWTTKVWDADNGCWRVNDALGFAYRAGRCVFDKSCFPLPYRADIRRLAEFLDDRETLEALRTIFFKFTPTLITMLREERYESIIDAYIAFREY